MKSKLRKDRFVIRILPSLVIIYMVSFFSLDHSFFPRVSHKVFYAFNALFWIIVPMLHTVRQSWGVSLLMTNGLSKGLGKKDEKLQRYIKFKKNAMNIYSVFLAALFVHHRFQELGFFYYVVIGGGGLVCIVNIVKFVQLKVEIPNNIILFDLKFLFFPLIIYSQIATWTLLVAHVFEYLALMRRSDEGYRALRNQKIYVAMALFTLVCLIYEFERLLQAKEIFYSISFVESPVKVILLSLFPFVTILHYYLDGVIFKMSDPEIRDSIGKTLLF